MSRSLGTLAFITLAMLCLSACGTRFLASRDQNPVTEDYIGGAWTGATTMGVMSTIAERRIVLMRLANDGEFKKGEFCAEPSPDAADNIARTFEAALKAQVTNPGTGGANTIGGAAAIATTYASTVALLLRRSQGLQLYRDGMYNFCQAYLNRIIDKAGYVKLAGDLLATAAKAIDTELQKGVPPLPSSVPASMPKVTLQMTDPPTITVEPDNTAQSAKPSEKSGTAP